MQKTTFAPMLGFSDAAAAMEFYKNAFNAVELRRWSNDDGTVHVGEMRIDDAPFYVREEFPHKGHFSAERHNGVTAIIVLLVDDPDAVMAQAIAAGGKEVTPIQDYDYHYRQGMVKDPFGHYWEISKPI